jgi:hypothetical protein
MAIQSRCQVGSIVGIDMAKQATVTRLPHHLWSRTVSLLFISVISGLVLTTSLWQTILTCIAIKGKNTMQVVAVTIFNYAFLGYAVMMVCPPLTSLSTNLC